MLTFSEIKQELPHRYPMLLVDRVVDLDEGQRLTAVKAITGNEPWYQRSEGAGEKGEDYPAVLVAESWCQSASLLAARARPRRTSPDPELMLLGGLSDVAFLAPVRPGDVIEHHVRLERSFGDTVILAGESVTGRQPVMTVGQLVIAWRPRRGMVTGRG